MMRCVESIKDLHDIVSKKNDIAFVPTMGNLHAGHIKLIERAKSLSDNVVVSIFINRTQFNSKKDYDTYPKTIIEDKNLLKMTIPKNIVFSPNEKDIFSYMPFKDYELPELVNDLCGKYRPGPVSYTHLRAHET